MTAVEPEFCVECEDQETVGLPSIAPPCHSDSCSNYWLPIDETGGAVSTATRLRGGSLSKQLTVTSVDPEDRGVIRCFIGADLKPQGLDVDLFNNPARLDGVDCVNPTTGASLYINPIRRISNGNDTDSLGALPFPSYDVQCDEEKGCEGFYPPPSSLDSAVYPNCGPELCKTITNSGCYPMIVIPKLSVIGAEVEGPVTIEYQQNIEGEFKSKFPLLAGSGVKCEDTGNAGTGATASAGGGSTATGGADNHDHDLTAHTHTGPSHSHSSDCSIVGRTVYTGTIDFSPVTIAAGATLNYCVTGSLRFNDTTWDKGGLVNYGSNVRLCLEGRSVINTETITALEGGS